MSVDTAGILSAVVDHGLTLGIFERFNGFEPKTSPGLTGIQGAAWVQHFGPVPARSGVASSSAQLVVNVRLYSSMLSEPQDAIDPRLTSAVDSLIAAYTGDLDLSSTVAFIDVLGQAGTSLAADAGYLEIDRKMFRVMTITLPLIVDDVWSQAL